MGGRFPSPGVRQALVIVLLPAWATLGVDRAVHDGPQHGATTRNDRPTSQPLPADPAAEQRLRSKLGPGARIARSPSFAIAHRLPREELSPLINRLEAAYARVRRFCRVLALPTKDPGAKLPVVFCDERGDFVRLLMEAEVDPNGTCGAYCHASGWCVLSEVDQLEAVAGLRREIAEARTSLAAAEEAVKALGSGETRVRLEDRQGRTEVVSAQAARERIRADRSRLRQLEREFTAYTDFVRASSIDHEVVHQSLISLGVFPSPSACPLWLWEGLASALEVDLSDSCGALGINPWRLRDYGAAYRRGGLLSVTNLLGDNDHLVKSVSKPAIFYAQAWAMVYYLVRKYPGRFAAYVRALAVRRPGSPVVAGHELGEFKGYFGLIDHRFVARWEGHILGLLDRRGHSAR